jgi:nitrogen fixation NifU-like protein
MTQLDELYREVILDHYRNPRRRGALHGDHLHAEGINPSCGDEFSLDIEVRDGVVVDAAMQGQGCSISQASGSMMMDTIVGKSVEDVTELTHKFKLMMSIEDGDNPVDPDRPGSVLGDLEALQVCGSSLSGSNVRICHGQRSVMLFIRRPTNHDQVQPDDCTHRG